MAPPTTGTLPGRLIPVGHQPEGLVVDGPTGLAAVSVRGGATGDGVELVDVASGQERGLVPTRGAARHLQLAAPGGPVLVPAEGSDTLDAVALTAQGIVGDVHTGRQPHDATALAGRVLVTDELADRVTVVAGLLAGPGTSAQVTATVPVPVQPGGIAAGVEADGRTPVALVVGVRGRQVEALSPAGADLGRADAGFGPTHVRAGDGRFYVADTSGSEVLVDVVGPRGPRQVGAVRTPGGAPYGIAVDAARRRVFVTLTATNTLVEYAVAGDGLRQVRTWPTPRQPNDVAVDPATGDVVVAGTGADVLQVLAP